MEAHCISCRQRGAASLLEQLHHSLLVHPGLLIGPMLLDGALLGPKLPQAPVGRAVLEHTVTRLAEAPSSSLVAALYRFSSPLERQHSSTHSHSVQHFARETTLKTSLVLLLLWVTPETQA